MWIIGDVHGKFHQYKNLIEYLNSSIQLGDMGIMKEKDLDRLSIINSNSYFFRGNHDDPFLVQYHPQYLGDYGYDEERDLFWLSGGVSIDQGSRLAGRDWWPEEELSFQRLYDALDLYTEAKPQFVVTHECPEDATPFVTNNFFSSLAAKYCPSRTSQALQQMFEAYQPCFWVFGHYHTYREFSLYGTNFFCLDELGCVKLPIETWT